jgi:hypothetical protein
VRTAYGVGKGCCRALGQMSRPMTAEAMAAFETKYGYKVSRFRVAVDAPAVYVNKANPIPCLNAYVGAVLMWYGYAFEAIYVVLGALLSASLLGILVYH